MADDPFRGELNAVADDLVAGIAFLTRVPARLLQPGATATPDVRRAARVSRSSAGSSASPAARFWSSSSTSARAD
jgi:hypothetical protein